MEATNIKCLNCGGSGNIKAFKHISGGICFHCDGSGNEDIFTAKQIAKGEKPRICNTFEYANRKTGEMRFFVIYQNGTSNVGTVADARNACREAIADGAELIDVRKMF